MENQKGSTSKKSTLKRVLIPLVIILASITILVVFAIPMPSTAIEGYVVKEPYTQTELQKEYYTDNECTSVNIKGRSSIDHISTECADTEQKCSSTEQYCCGYQKECASYEQYCCEKNWYGGCVKYCSRCASYKDVCNKQCTRCSAYEYPCTKYRTSCRAVIENIDSEGGSFR